MLLISNGPYKSGSTWLFNLLKTIVEPAFPPPELCDPSWRHPSLIFKNISSFAVCSSSEITWITKNHLPPQEVLSLAELAPHKLLFFSIERNLPDTVVSAWHHHRKRFDQEIGIRRFYWKFGRVHALSIKKHNMAMRLLGKKKAIIMNYEELLASPIKCIDDLIKFLEYIAVKRDASFIAKENNFLKLREKYSEDGIINGKDFFRSGKVGEGKSTLEPSMLKDLEKIESGGGSSFYSRVNAIIRRELSFFSKNSNLQKN
jgi:hypothetical protein